MAIVETSISNETLSFDYYSMSSNLRTLMPRTCQSSTRTRQTPRFERPSRHFLSTRKLHEFAEMKKANPKISHQPTPYGSGTSDSTSSRRIGSLKPGQPCFVFDLNPFIPWVCDVAEILGIPSAMLWVQSAASFSSYYHYSHSLVPFPSESQPEIDVQLPCMPLLKYDEVPSFLHPSSPYTFLKTAILGQFKNISKLTFILMETFQELEHDVVNYLSKNFPSRLLLDFVYLEGEAENRIIPRDEVEKHVREATNGPKAAEIKEEHG
ncbi:hypothetical protein HAX54_036907 [Datura stramonium]|uniref:Uncharacterized protein n=1 Tax=Datura stramonium TaxID=4076 RepID=A0ABS8VKR6_DATST|nr:hypothetical protein [Datura stramonium]